MQKDILTVVLLLFLVSMSAYFSASETAFSSLNITRIKSLAEKGNKKADLVLKLSAQYDKLLSSILIGNNIVNIAMASVGTVLFVRYFGNVGATISTVVITVVVLIFGEISPKSLAKDNPERFAFRSAPLLKFFVTVFTDSGRASAPCRRGGAGRRNKRRRGQAFEKRNRVYRP